MNMWSKVSLIKVCRKYLQLSKRQKLYYDLWICNVLIKCLLICSTGHLQSKKFHICYSSSGTSKLRFYSSAERKLKWAFLIMSCSLSVHASIRKLFTFSTTLQNHLANIFGYREFSVFPHEVSHPFPKGDNRGISSSEPLVQF